MKKLSSLNHVYKFIKSSSLALAAALALNLFSHKVEADLLFEGYYKVTLTGVHAGYVIQRYEFDAAKKVFTGTSFSYVRLNADGKQFLNESLVAKSSDAFIPISYLFSGLYADKDPATGQIKNRITSIDANFKKVGDKTQAQMKGLLDGKNFKNTLTFSRKVFLSNFLIYLILQNGLKTGKSFQFEALAEETGKIGCGIAQIKEEKKLSGIDSFKMIWDFKQSQPTLACLNSINLKESFNESFLAASGNPLSTDSPAQGVRQELVATKEAAVASLPFAEKSIKALFGDIPKGQKNTVAEKIGNASTTTGATPAGSSTPPPTKNQ